jgi:hypothetical protein
MAMMRGVTYDRSRSKPSSVKRFFFFDTMERMRPAMLLSEGVRE